MIITEHLLVDLGACQEAVDWCRDNNLYGKTRRDFIRSIKDAGTTIPDYYFTWCAETLFCAAALKCCCYHDNYRIKNVMGTSLDFTTVEEARQYIMDQCIAHHEKENHFFHIQARYRLGEDGYNSEMCDITLDTAPDADYYATFNYTTGQYENFDTYALARARALELKQERKCLTDGMFRLQRQVTGPENELDWEDI
jgi:hypothetical protein